MTTRQKQDDDMQVISVTLNNIKRQT